MTQTNRRVFIGRAVAAGALMGSLRSQAATHVEDTDEQAVALGYKHDTNLVDKAKYAKHEASQHCANCSFFQGAKGDEWGGCAMFGRKHVAATGWCMAWAKAPGS
ncbi:MAG: high-potential iron-sulfur protein [Burkholderiales bacterium]|nr:high-potential iron-sulfur protein [Burkholderiales bacterium]